MDTGDDTLDLKDANTAFSSFFAQDAEGNVAQSNSDSPSLNKVLGQIKENQKPPGANEITKVNVGDDAGVETDVLSVDEAQQVMDSHKSFKEVLKENDVAFSDLFAIIDSYLEIGYYEQVYSIKSLRFSFRTKAVHSIDSINDALDGSKYTLQSAAGQLLLERSLAATVTSFKLGNGNRQVFEHKDEGDDEKALEFVRNLHAPIYSILINKLRRFELLTGLASHEEALNHFLEHTQD